MQKALTDKTIEALKPQAKRYDVHDLRCPGMALRVSPSGLKSFYIKFRYGLAQKHPKLGSYPRMSLATAREKANEWLRQVDQGIDPTKRKRTTNMKVESVCREFIRLHAQARNKSWREAERILERELVGSFGQRDIREITRYDVLELMDAAIDRGSGYQANRILAHTTPRKANDRRKAAFLAEWHSTLQILRDIGATVSLDANRPVWVNAMASPGAQADQFLHAHYYHRTFEGRKADYERHFSQNHANPIKARNEAIAWWQGLASAPTNEDVAINTTAQRLQELLSENALKRMTLPQFREVAGDVHAMIEFSRRVRNSIVGLPSSGIAYTIPQKLDALTAQIWNSKAENGSSVTGVITHILYGGPDDLLPERLWEAVADPKWKLECMGISAYGELVGWAMPDKFPPRNGRTSKALRSLGYDVQVHVS